MSYFARTHWLHRLHRPHQTLLGLPFWLYLPLLDNLALSTTLHLSFPSKFRFDSLPLLAKALPEIRVEARVAVTFTITPPGENALHFSADALAEWSSHYSIPLPLIENSAELLAPAPALVQPTPANAGPDDQSSNLIIKFLLIYREGKTLFDGLGHSYNIKRTSKISRTWRCNRHAKPHFCRGIAFEVMGAKSFSVKVPHTCPANLDVEQDASLITKTKVNACSDPLVSSRKVVEKEMLKIFQQNPDRNLPVVANVVRAVFGIHAFIRHGLASTNVVAFLIKMHAEAEKLAMTAKLLSQSAQKTQQGRRIETAPTDHHMGIF
ncbi:hypothetical protein DAPPUDRAFT_323258 [Daphnia pulex]|uniref:FLYWCH-type domain-containing protein n=1 Tax=Daphnia pulex TaxID=6669 RepID=E9GYC0_DAPPU|nr:hypothetical protein DAPPUDRAFT_323258 [Daphnia pulex]|eukprot:EFX75574.1 hypothetical protein DAPPUDRAFT_323258 [Daphnia pulex]